MIITALCCRAENEKLLMSMYGIDEEDLVGAEIPHQTRSYFMDLIEMEDEELLDQFINNQEPRFFNKEKVNRRQQMKQMDQESFQPEEAFMKIGFNLRQALKKHPPMGMLEVIPRKFLGEIYYKLKVGIVYIHLLREGFKKKLIEFSIKDLTQLIEKKIINMLFFGLFSSF